MTETATAETPAETKPKKRGRPPKAKPQTYTLSKAELDELVQQKIQQLLNDAPYAHQPSSDAVEQEVSRRLAKMEVGQAVEGEPRRFMDWPPYKAAPHGFQKVKQNDGTFVLENLPPVNFDPELRRITLEKVDAKYNVYKIPTDEHPTPKDPARLVVNREWRKLFRNVVTWGDTCQIEIDESAFEDNTKPQFRFERE